MAKDQGEFGLMYAEHMSRTFGRNFYDDLDEAERYALIDAIGHVYQEGLSDGKEQERDYWVSKYMPAIELWDSIKKES